MEALEKRGRKWFVAYIGGLLGFVVVILRLHYSEWLPMAEAGCQSLVPAVVSLCLVASTMKHGAGLHTA